jgi:phospholipid-binding lipoprotein MlaA
LEERGKMRSAVFAGLTALLLSACASQNLSIRTLPPETPAADNAAAIKNAAVLAAVAAAASRGATDQMSARAVAPLTTAEAPSMYSYDPWERVNRLTYCFNARFDDAVFLPVAYDYGHLPAPIRAGVHNFFDNLTGVQTVVNYALQWHPVAGARSLGRFLINSTVGIGGLFDVASKFHLDSEPTGLSMTLSRWGMHPGPYVVLPLYGPSTLRDAVGLLGDFGISYFVDVTHLYRGNKTWALGVVDAVDQRSNTSFRYYSTGSPFEYETVRFLYVHRELIEDDALHPSKHPRKQDVDVPAGK